MSKNQFYNCNQINKVSAFCNFCSVLFWFSCSDFLRHVLLINVYHLLLRCCKSFWIAVIRGLWCQIMQNCLESFWWFLCHNKYQTIIIKLLKGRFLQKQFRKKLILISQVFFNIVTLELWTPHATRVYLLKVNNRNTRTRCEICWKSTIKTLERRQWRCSGVFIVNFEHVSHLVLLFLLLTLNM